MSRGGPQFRARSPISQAGAKRNRPNPIAFSHRSWDRTARYRLLKQILLLSPTVFDYHHFSGLLVGPEAHFS
jgi:nuclear transport factor 2 (NTF2) superfamily protein